MDNIKIIAKNKKAFHDYFVEEKYEAGISLSGTEVKSLREGKVNLKDSWCSVQKNELFVNAMHISPYRHEGVWGRDPMRVRKLLMHRREINRLSAAVAQKGYSLIPLSLYFRGSLVKIEIGLCRGKKLYDKRETEAKKSAQRDIDRAMKSR